jgi:hypothetical protein
MEESEHGRAREIEKEKEKEKDKDTISPLVEGIESFFELLRFRHASCRLESEESAARLSLLRTEGVMNKKP